MFIVKRNILNIVSLIVSACFLFLLISFILQKTNLNEKNGYSNNRTKVISKQITNQEKETLYDNSDNAVLNKTPKTSEFDSIYIIDQGKLEILLALKIPLILAYFSPWCGHCKHFIPLFIEFASDYRLHHSFDNHRIDSIGNNTNNTNNNSSKNKEEVNIEKLFGYNIKQNRFIFGTIDCTAEKRLCENIERTPMVLAQYYKKGESSMTVQNIFKKGMASKARDDMTALSDFIKQKFQTNVDIINKAGNESMKVYVTDKDSTVLINYKNDFKNWLEMTQNGLARISEPDLRLRDGLMSLNYMIAEESLRAFDETKRMALRAVLSLTIKLLPSHMKNLSLAYQNIESLLDQKTFLLPGEEKGYSHAKIVDKQSWFSYVSGKKRKSNFKNNLRDNFDRNKNENKNIRNNFDDEWMYSVKLGVIDINRMLNKFENKQYKYQDNNKKTDHEYIWHVCGRISSTDQRDTKKEDSNKRKTIRVRNLKENENHGNEADSVGPDLGYTCGLWLLLHYYTVASERHQEEYLSVRSNPYPSPNTTVVMSTIRTLVSDLFSCSECRTNFLNMFDTCEFNRCTIREKDYSLLQYWLFQAHNSATVSIFNTKKNYIFDSTFVENGTYNNKSNDSANDILSANNSRSTCNSSMPHTIHGVNKTAYPPNLVDNLETRTYGVSTDRIDSTITCSHGLNSSIPQILYPPLTSCLSCYNHSRVNYDINNHHNNNFHEKNKNKNDDNKDNKLPTKKEFNNQYINHKSESDNLWNYNEILKHLKSSYWDEKWKF